VNWLSAVEAMSASVLSPQTKAPEWFDLARVPAAKLKLPAAVVLKPPGTVA
jgi:hypothetical protein